MARAGAGAGAEIKDKSVAGAENKSFRLPNTEKLYFLQNKAHIFFSSTAFRGLVIYYFKYSIFSAQLKFEPRMGDPAAGKLTIRPPHLHHICFKSQKQCTQSSNFNSCPKGLR